MNGTATEGHRAGAWRAGRARRTAVALAAAIAVPGGLAAPAPATAQDTAVRLPFGASAVVLPVQSALPSAGGRWPGRAAGEEAALRTMDAELAFALAERRAARGWALADDLRRRVRRNPMLEVDPDRVAYQGLVRRPDRTSQIYEPLHGELRTLAALFGTRYVVLPIRLGAPAVDDGAGAPAPTCDGGAAPQRPELLLALIDVRRSAVLWHGTVHGPAACPDAGGLLAGLAAAVAGHLTEG